MTTLSELFPSSGAIKSIQTGWVASVASSGSGEDAKYVDVTVSAVTVANCVCFFYGASGSTATGSQSYSAAVFAQPRLTSTTNLRIGSNAGTYITGRWYVVEYN